MDGVKKRQSSNVQISPVASQGIVLELNQNEQGPAFANEKGVGQGAEQAVTFTFHIPQYIKKLYKVKFSNLI